MIAVIVFARMRNSFVILKYTLMNHPQFKDRHEAGSLLADKMNQYRASDAVILAIPRGGVPVGYEMAKLLELPLDIALSKKIGHPYNKEYAIGSVSLDSAVIRDRRGVSEEYISNEIIRIRESLEKQYRLFMDDRKPVNTKNKTVIIVDDGIATGSTILSTIEMLRKNGHKNIVVAVPVLPRSAVSKLTDAANELVFLISPSDFIAVGAYYEDFTQVTDAEVMEMLAEAYSMKGIKHH